MLQYVLNIAIYAGNWLLFGLRTVNLLADRAILFDAENTKSADLNLSHTEKRGVTRLCIAENAELKIRKARVTA